MDKFVDMCVIEYHAAVNKARMMPEASDLTIENTKVHTQFRLLGDIMHYSSGDTYPSLRAEFLRSIGDCESPGVARWIQIEGTSSFRCSHCTNKHEGRTNYCDYCGYKMI